VIEILFEIYVMSVNQVRPAGINLISYSELLHIYISVEAIY